MKFPLIPTLFVGSACAAMVGLGIWQVQRMGEKETLISRFESNRAISAEIAYPISPPDPEIYLFRRAGVMCLEPVTERTEFAGRKGNTLAYRRIVACRTGIEGPGAVVDIGWSSDPASPSGWKGGPVRGVIAMQPDRTSLIAKLFTRGKAMELMLVASPPAAGLKASDAPDLKDVPNNHLAYAGQWFLFAAMAALIYVLALMRKSAGLQG